MRFENYKVVVNGAAHGVGLAAAKLFFDEGATVIGLDKSFPSDLNLGEKFIPRVCNAADTSEIESASAYIGQRFGGTVDTLVNAFGIASVGTPKTFTTEEYAAVMDIMLRAPMVFCRTLYPYLEKAEQKNPSIVNLSSVMAFSNAPRFFLYNLANTAIVKFTKMAAVEFKDVRCNSVSPGFDDSNFFTREGKYSQEEAQKLLDEFAAISAAKRLTKPEEVAEIIAYLASSDAAYITGADILADGGTSARIM